MLKKLMWITVVPVFLLLCLYMLMVYQNNRSIAYPQPEQLQRKLEKSVLWLVEHEEQIVNENNAMLWWMLYETQKIAPDSRIADLLDKYMQRYKSMLYGAWGPLFDKEKHSYLGGDSVRSMPYYNQHFIYALNCAGKIAAELPEIKRQNEASFCHQLKYFYRPACTTHQLMGINFLFTGQCNELPEIDEVSRSLQQDIVLQLTLDVRVVDVYLQRVLMLLITGAEDSVKPIWIQQVLDHQLEDGSWGDFDPLLRLGDAGSLGFSSQILSIRQEQRGSFHATAQGVYMLSYLLVGQNNTRVK